MYSLYKGSQAPYLLTSTDFFFFHLLTGFYLFCHLFCSPPATRTGPLSCVATLQHTLEVKAAGGCFKRRTYQKSENYSTENNIHAPSISTRLFFFLHPIIKKRESTTPTKSKFCHIY